MKTKLSPVLAGAFVLGALALAAVALLSFPSWHVFSKPGHFIAYFSESAQGLDAGSAVKLKGVRVGRVTKIRIQYDSKTRRSRVVVVAELEPKVMSDTLGQIIAINDRATLERLVIEGLRAKIDLAGITGMQFVELDFVDPAGLAAPRFDPASQFAEVPTIRSGMSELTANLSKIVTSVNKIDFAGISAQITTLLTNANKQVDGLDLKKLVAQVTAAATSISDMAGSTEAKAAFGNLNKTAIDVQGLVVKLDAQVEPARADLARTLLSFRDAADGLSKLLGPQSGMGDEVAGTLRQLTETAVSLQELADFLERNPNALITGKRRTRDAP